MSEVAIETRRDLQESVKASLRKAEGIVSVHRNKNTLLLATTLISSAGATMVTGVTAAIGQAASIGTEGWRTACIIAAIFGFISTISVGLSEQLRMSDRLSEEKFVLSKLRHLDVVITTGRISWEEITMEYEEIAKDYPELIY
jgi:hypothetical protein